MARSTVYPTEQERIFRHEQIIVSKTDLKGRLTYCNDVFRAIGSFTDRELLGQPHSIIRHPDMPRCVFKLLWDTVASGREFFGYVKNMASNGDHYWVLAHVTPSRGPDGTVVGYHSNRRQPKPAAIATIETLYRSLKAVEDRPDNRKDGMTAAHDCLIGLLKDKGVGYDQFVLSL